VRSNYFEKFNQLKCCVVIPTFNNASTLAQVLDGILGYTSNVIVVNDGSTDNTQDVLLNFKGIEVLHNSKNKGKGSALRLAFKFALEREYDYAITIDSDGQHRPDELPTFIDFIERNPGFLVVGARNMEQEGIPGKSSFGHKFSNFWFRIETGINLPDTQSGYRLYPIKKLSTIRFFTRKFEFEIEVLVRAAWTGIQLQSVPVSVFYAPVGERVSHFRPFKDFFRISILNTILVAIAICYARPLYYYKNFSIAKFKKLIGSGEPVMNLSLAVGLGAFMGIFPIWGYQMIVGVFIAHIFKLNKALVIVATNVSFPPFIPFILYGSLVMGKWFVADPIHLTFNQNIDLHIVKTGLVQYICGSILLAFLTGILMTLLTYVSLKIRRRENRS
jgi:glycosyltransferase involved in cell wall biosynthesis